MPEMLVETFDCTESAALPIEAAEEAVTIINDMGLEGQQSLIRKSDKSGREAVMPYRIMTAEERFTYGVLCPTKTKIGKYASGPIPLRVLQIAAHAKSIEAFTDLQIWHAADATEKDPVLVGVGKDPASTWRDGYFILARWGEELETFVVLLKRAITRKREQLKQQAIDCVAKAKFATIEADTLPDEKIIGADADGNITLHTPSNFR